MTQELLIAIVTAIISAIGTIIATKFELIVDVFRRSSRIIEGEWEGENYPIEYGLNEKAHRRLLWEI